MSTYTLPTPITQDDLDHARSLADQGRLADMYDHLASFGDRYSILAKGVVEGDTLSGVAAIEFMKNTTEAKGIDLTEADIDAIRADMATGYLDTLQGILDDPDNTTGTINREIDAQEAQAFHDQVFVDAGLGEDAWTLNTPFEIFGEQGAQEHWEKTLDAAGHLGKELVLAAGLHQWMAFTSSRVVDEQKEQMRSWSSRFDNRGAAWKLVLAFGEQGITDSRDWLTDFFEEMGGPSGALESPWNYWTGGEFIDDIRDFFNRGQSHASPIILDLDGNGVSTVGLDAGVQFDHNGDGFAQATGWVGPADALLAMDLTGNEEIETGSELFGNASEIEEGVTAMNGFEALAIHDTNGNGRIDPGDEAWGDLRLWQDTNGNGEVDDGELLTLDEVGIGSIDLGYTNSTYVDEHGNEHRQIGRFEWADGREGEATDVWFIQDTAQTEARERLDVPEDIATLPDDLMGYGEVHDLHQAQVRPAANAPTFGSNFDKAA